MAQKYNQVRLKLVSSFTNLKTAMTGFRFFPDPEMLTPTHPIKKNGLFPFSKHSESQHRLYSQIKATALLHVLTELPLETKGDTGTQHLGTQECEGELFFTRESESIRGTLQTFSFSSDIFLLA